MTDLYPLIKNLHMTLATISIVGFILRFIWMSQGSSLADRKLSKVLPHILDTFLLLMGLALAVMLKQYPFVDAWLTVKLLLLVLYIGLGAMALSRKRAQPLRLMFFVGAVVVFAQMVGVAIKHSAWGWMA